MRQAYGVVKPRVTRVAGRRGLMRQRLVLQQRVLTATLTLMAVVVAWSMFPLTLPEHAVALEQPQAQLEGTGTLAQLDLSAGKGMLINDPHKADFFPPRPPRAVRAIVDWRSRDDATRRRRTCAQSHRDVAGGSA